jgi:mannose-6-phosphate isomerase-like protein (cupin superfamily)
VNHSEAEGRLLAPFKRVVTGHDASGKAVVLSTDPPPHLRTSTARPGFWSADVWATEAMPAPIHRSGEPTDRPHRLEPPEGGTVCRIVEFPPDATWIGKLAGQGAGQAFGEMWGGGAHSGAAGQPHPMMHRTRTVDYGIVLSGEIHLVVDDGEVKLQAGDVVVQRGTNHAWSNRSDQPARMAFILIDGAWEE